MDDSVRLQQAIQLAREGKRQEAYQQLSEYVKRDPHNEQAWLWLSGVVDKPEHTRACLERVLVINPQNAQAKQGLEWLLAKQAAAPVSTPAKPPQAVEPAKPASRPSYDVMDPLAPTSSTSSWSLKSEPNPPITNSLDNATNQLEPAQAARESTPLADNPSLTNASLSPATSGSGALNTSSTWPAKQEQAVVSNRNSTVQRELDSDEPCIFCGHPNNTLATHCADCKQNLIVTPVRDPDAKLSFSTKILMGIWIFSLLSIPFLVILLYETFQNYQYGLIESSDLVRILISSLISIVLPIWLIWSLYHVQAAGYIVHVIFTVIAVIQLLIAIVSMLLLRDYGGPNSVVGGRLLAWFLLVLMLFVFAMVVATFFAFREFFPKKERYQPSFRPANDLVHIDRGDIFKKHGMTYLAIREWEAALAQRPNYVALMYDIAMAYHSLKQNERAKELIAKALKLEPQNRTLLKTQAMLEAS
jgi:tetratricopeptide (TPR) repeat protein